DLEQGLEPCLGRGARQRSVPDLYQRRDDEKRGSPRGREALRPCQHSQGGCQVKISREDVLRVADLAYLDLGEAELETYRAQIDEILEYIGKLNELDTGKVEPMAQVVADDQTADATLREDLVVPCAVADDVLEHAPDPEPPYFLVPKVIERCSKGNKG